MNCPICGKEMTMSVEIGLHLPSTYAHRISKKAISTKDCRIAYANWEKAFVACTCGFRMKGI